MRMPGFHIGGGVGLVRSASCGRGTGDGGRGSWGVGDFLSGGVVGGVLVFLLGGCAVQRAALEGSRVNVAHLDRLLEVVDKEGEELGIVHIYSEAPEYGWVHDEDEGAACVDDAARAAVFYMRDVELTGDAVSRRKAEALIRFILYMQTDEGLFYNFVWNSDLDVNTEHQNSRADAFSWWAARAVWALGRCAEVFSEEALGVQCAEAALHTFPHLEAHLQAYGETFEEGGRRYPRWLLHETASDATSELLLGLAALNRTGFPAERSGMDSDAAVAVRLNVLIKRFAEGIEMMQYGQIGDFPYGAHASWTETWHAWGNAQTQVLAQIGSFEARSSVSRRSQPDTLARTSVATAIHEADHFYPFLLVEGWLHSMDFSKPGEVRRFEQIAYGVRGVALGLLELYGATGDVRYATMAGLAASWFTGNNVAGAAMYDPASGRGYDGIGGPDDVNRNAGAESTIEALMTLAEIERNPEARRWLFARGEDAESVHKDGKRYRYRVFRLDSAASRVGVVLNLTDHESLLLEGDSLAAFLDE